MAERNTDKKESHKKPASNPKSKSASGQAKKGADALWAKEQQYKLLNAELEAKTANLVKQTEQFMREHIEGFSKTFSKAQLLDIEDDESLSSWLPKSQPSVVKDPVNKRISSPSQNLPAGKQKQKCPPNSRETRVDDDSSDCFLTKTIQSLEEKMNGLAVDEKVEDEELTPEDFMDPYVYDTQVRVLKAKLRIMHEELDQLTREYHKKDDENTALGAKIKELEEERSRLQKKNSIQQTQMEKQRTSTDESAKKCDVLQLQVSALHKEIENLNKSHKQAAAAHRTVEIRLNRALEEAEKFKSQLDKVKQTNKDMLSEEHQSRERLLAENKTLKKQKAELMAGFKKQLELIDVLKKQKMHFEAVKLLSFTEDEFMKALDWAES